MSPARELEFSYLNISNVGTYNYIFFCIVHMKCMTEEYDFPFQLLKNHFAVPFFWLH